MFTRISDLERLFGTMNLLQRKLDNVYSDRGKNPKFKWSYDTNYPGTNMYEKGDGFEVRMEVPGLEKDDLNVNIQGNYLEISGTKKSAAPEGYRKHRTEIGTGSFSRSFTLPSDVDSTKVDATLKDGILYLVLPKTEASKPKKITVS